MQPGAGRSGAAAPRECLIPTEVALGRADGLPRACVAILDTITTIPKAALTQQLAVLTPEKLAAVDPDSLGALYARWRVHELSGNWFEALASLRRIAALQPVFAPEVEINVRVYRADGAAGYWRHRTEDNARLGRIDEAAAGYAALGDADRAFAQLESGFAAKDPQLTVLLYSPYLKPLRSDPRFADLARRMGLPAPKP